MAPLRTRAQARRENQVPRNHVTTPHNSESKNSTPTSAGNTPPVSRPALAFKRAARRNTIFHNVNMGKQHEILADRTERINATRDKKAPSRRATSFHQSTVMEDRPNSERDGLRYTTDDQHASGGKRRPGGTAWSGRRVHWDEGLRDKPHTATTPQLTCRNDPSSLAYTQPCRLTVYHDVATPPATGKLDSGSTRDRKLTNSQSIPTALPPPILLRPGTSGVTIRKTRGPCSHKSQAQAPVAGSSNSTPFPQRVVRNRELPQITTVAPSDTRVTDTEIPYPTTRSYRSTHGGQNLAQRLPGSPEQTPRLGHRFPRNRIDRYFVIFSFVYFSIVLPLLARIFGLV